MLSSITLLILLLQPKVLLLGQVPAAPWLEQASTLPADLSEYAAIVVARSLSSSELQQLLSYIARGGCVLLLADIKEIPELKLNMTLKVECNCTAIELKPLAEWIPAASVEECIVEASSR